MIIISEIEIWERMIKWELVQNPKLPSDLKVLPYKKFLPKDLYKNLLNYDDTKKSEFHTVEEVESNNIDSKIITIQYAELISKWIDKLEIIDKLTTSYEFKLLYRDSRDGCIIDSINFVKFVKINSIPP
ncbi:uncharacterized protein OCT59_021333 [Rhizophagus irregularis]|uniref:Uncharacterized protein n=1 Tax=Rhizophagus irregularis (strain DAOM 181602 / DAOM 197198 / MUCL 43194) TaxID=747089 RepID=U9TEN9_RHIID|nr:hypothetical protein OCT59_021333 [Rhizophagus irregularis]